MDNPQRDKLDTCNRVKIFNRKYATQLATIEEYTAEEKVFNDAVDIANQAAQAQVTTAGASASAAYTAKETMANVIVKYALRAVIKAKQNGDQTLATNLDHPFTYILKAPKTLAVHRAKDIRENLNNNLGTLTNISVANIDEIDNAIAVYDAIKDAPTIDIKTKTATGTNPLSIALATATNAIDNMYDLVVSYFIGTNQPMVDELALAKQTITTGVHHNGISGTITNGGLPLQGTSLIIIGTGKTTTSDKSGHYHFSKVKSGDQTITATRADGSLQTKTTNITKANIETVDFEF